MTTFQDKFDRTDRFLNTDNGWKVVGDGSDSSAGIRIIDRAARNVDGADETFASQETTIAATGDQHVSAWIQSTVQNANAWIQIGIAGRHNATWSSRTQGVFARLTWKTNGERTLDIRHQISGEDSAVTLKSLTLVDSNGDVQSGYYGRLNEKGAVNVLQHLRLIVRADDFGLKAQAYINHYDDDRPTLEEYIRTDLVGADSSNPFGYWWFGFGDSATNESLVVSEFSGEDYALTDRRRQVWLGDNPTLDELMERVKRRFSGANYDIDDLELREIINDETEQILNRLGDEAFFLHRVEQFRLTYDSDGYAQLPLRVERPLHIERQGQRLNAFWVFAGHESDGTVLIRLDRNAEPDNANYLVTYLQRWERMFYPSDQTCIPRRHTEVVVLGACRTLAATRAQMSSLAGAFTALYEERWLGLKREMTRYWQQQGIAMRPKRRRLTRPFHDIFGRF